MSRRRPPFPRYLAFVCLSIGLAVVGFLAFESVTGVLQGQRDLRDAVGGLFSGIAFGVVIGWIFWAPILIVALFPGYLLFGWFHRALCALTPGSVLPNLVPAIGISLLSGAFALAGPAMIFGATELPEIPYDLLPFGVGAAMLAAFLVLIRREEE